MLKNLNNHEQTYLRLELPGISTQEMDSRKLQLQVYQQARHIPENRGRFNPGPFPLRWQESTAAWASEFIVASKGPEALKLLLPIGNSLQKSDFALAFTIAYQLEAERDLIHPTSFHLHDLHITATHFTRVMNEGTFTVAPVESLPLGIGNAPFMLFKQEDLVHVDV